MANTQPIYNYGMPTTIYPQQMSTPSTKKSADPLPYIILFAILFLISLAVLTWTLDVWSKAHSCALYPNIWCSDNWSCATNCSSGYSGNQCFVNGMNSTGLSSCLFGPNAAGATACFFTPTGGTAGSLSCECTPAMTAAPNCFSQCAQSFGNIAQNIPCCCCPGTKGCPYTFGNIPSGCGNGSSCSNFPK